jgi:uncharacterized protein
MFARHFIDSLDFARNGRELHGTVPVAEMPRLQDVLATPDGEISYVIRGTQDRSGKPLLEVTMDGLCQLRCQRCLNGYAYPVKLVSRLLLTQKVDLDEFADDEAELDSILADDRLDVIALLEEELLLSLPFAPKHPLGACQAATEGLHEPEKNPFAVLAELKKK